MRMNIKSEIEKLLQKTLDELGVEFSGDINLEHPQDLKNGDYTTNIAMQIAGKAGKNPREIAAQFQATLSEKLPKNIEKVEIAGAGYLNFYIKDDFFLRELLLGKFNVESDRTQKGITMIRNNGIFFEMEKKEGKILLEHSSPNLFKPFHIGHMVNNAIGESLVRILIYSGADVKTAAFPSDVSPGIAKTI